MQHRKGEIKKIQPPPISNGCKFPARSGLKQNLALNCKMQLPHTSLSRLVPSISIIFPHLIVRSQRPNKFNPLFWDKKFAFQTSLSAFNHLIAWFSKSRLSRHLPVIYHSLGFPTILVYLFYSFRCKLLHLYLPLLTDESTTFPFHDIYSLFF